MRSLLIYSKKNPKLNLGAAIQDMVTHLQGCAKYKNDTYPDWAH